MITAFRGWNDGGQGASLGGRVPRPLLAGARASPTSIPSSSSTSRRPDRTSRWSTGSRARSTGPTTPSTTRRFPGMERDALLLLGVEPNVRWRTFSGLVTTLASELGVELVVTLGSLFADVPHTRPSPGDRERDRRRARPAARAFSRRATKARRGSSACCTTRARTRGLPSASLWAAVPHYVSLAPSPRAALALCGRLAELSGRRSTRPSSRRRASRTPSRSARPSLGP